MLILTRKIDESIIVGDNIKITVIEIQGDNVRIGIDAPRELSIHREEIYQAIRQENRQAVLQAGGAAGLLKQVKGEGK
ncbi:MAG: carbon storage regulator CsrA [Syntrophomonadaceae bacterium]|jgi:carbon storage regulator|nr:carbon storage regulator CsrA [Syntrophomonadaceae bacterium]